MLPETLVVIPCYNEAARLPVAAFEEFLSRATGVGFLMVNDGSRDGTLQVLRDLAARHPETIDVLDLQPNQGKAEAVRKGLLQAIERGASHVGFWDADLATPLDVISDFQAVLRDHPGIDWVLGARVRLLGRRIDRKAARHLIGRVFATVASLSLGVAVYDTQCGAKLFRRESTLEQVLREPFASRWLFDVELIGRYLSARRSLGDARPEHRIVELPLRTWIDVGGSKLKPTDFLRAGVELMGIWYRLRLGTPKAADGRREAGDGRWES